MGEGGLQGRIGGLVSQELFFVVVRRFLGRFFCGWGDVLVCCCVWWMRATLGSARSNGGSLGVF